MWSLFWSLFPLLLSQIYFVVSYVSNTNSFPKPLSASEERECLSRMKKGDMEAKNILIERNLRLVAHVIKKYTTTCNDSDDFISIGTIGLIKAINTFDIDKGTRLATYAARCIENAILAQWKHLHIRLKRKLIKHGMIYRQLVAE